MVNRRMRLSLVVVLATLLVPAGCADARQQAALDVATRFVAAAEGDPEQACELLAEVSRNNLEDSGDASCAEELPGLGMDLPSTGASAVVQGRQAIVKIGEQAIFLSLYDHGWRVLAADCQRDSDDVEVPWVCGIEGN